MIYRLIFVIALLSSSHAFAGYTKWNIQQGAPYPQETFSKASDALQAGIAAWNARYPGYGASCEVTVTNDSNGIPYHYTCKIVSGENRNHGGFGVKGSDLKICTAGTESSSLVPVGWATYYPGTQGTIPMDGGGSATIQGDVKIPDSVCIAGCEYWNVGSTDSYISFDRPSGTGAYQVLNNINTESSGQTCNSDSDFSKPSTAAPTCIGTVGTVNGKEFCAGEGDGGNNGDGDGKGDGDGGDEGDGDGDGNGDGDGDGDGGGNGNGDGEGDEGGDGDGSGGGHGGGDGDGDGKCPEGQDCSGGSGTGPTNDWKVPEFYEKKYKQGLKEIYQSSGLNDAVAPFEALAGSLAPDWIDTRGACQSFGMTIDVGIINFGRFDFSPPCIIWPFLWLCMQIGAVFLFRALVFGG